VIAQNDISHHPPLSPPEASLSYWPTAQVPCKPSVSTALPMEPMYYPTSCYDNQDLPVTHRHTATDDHFQHGLHGVCGGTTSYGTSSYTEPDTTLATPAPAPTLPAPGPHLTITHDQDASENDLTQWDPSVMRSTLYEVSTLRHLLGNDTRSQGLVLGKCRRHCHHHRNIPGH
jgi:hypothetical protein